MKKSTGRLRRALATGGLVASIISSGISGKSAVESEIDYHKALEGHPGTKIVNQVQDVRGNIFRAGHDLKHHKTSSYNTHIALADSSNPMMPYTGENDPMVFPRLSITEGETTEPSPQRARERIDEAIKGLNRQIDPSGKVYQDLMAAKQSLPSTHSSTNNYQTAERHLDSAHNVVTPILIKNRDAAYEAARPYEASMGKSVLNFIAPIGAGVVSAFNMRRRNGLQSHLAVFISLLSLALAFMFFSPTIVGHVVSDTSPSTLNQAGIISLSIAIISLFVYAFKQSGMKIIILSREKHKPQAMLR